MTISEFLIYILMFINITSGAFSQLGYNINETEMIIDEYSSLEKNKIIVPNSNYVNLAFNQHFYFNSNLPNFENLNGLYFPKGYGSYKSFLILINYKNIHLSAEPQSSLIKEYLISPGYKSGAFSVLNDTQINSSSSRQLNSIRNLGIKVKLNNLTFGYGNWNHWWGPGLHNSLVISNNSQGFYHFYSELKISELFNNEIKINIKYLSSNGITNKLNKEFYLSTILMRIRYKQLELGASSSVLSGGNLNINWDQTEALLFPITKKYSKYWDHLKQFHALYISKNMKTRIFYEFAYPLRLNEFNSSEYYDHSRATNIGIRTNDAFNKNIAIGFEYTRLIQSIYYNILPSPNYFDNKAYNYSSFNQRRWSAHSGSDSDDFLIYFGYIDEKISFIYGINYERHGVNFHFPPEVKFENRFVVSFNQSDKINIKLRYENEYFEHYGFVDNHTNVWNETFNDGSIQRTKTLLFSILYKLF